MTPEQITQGNLDCAVKVMGLKEIPLPEMDAKHWTGKVKGLFAVEGNGDILVSWDGYSFHGFSPMTDPADCAMVKVRMRELRYFYCFWGGPGELFTAVFQESKSAPGALIKADTEESAVTLAAIKAMEATR